MSESSAATVDHLAQWQAVDTALRQKQIVYGVASREQVAGKSGLAIFQAMIAGELPAPPISQTLDFILVEAEPGRVVFQGRPGFAHYNPMGTVHGGWFATLLDWRTWMPTPGITRFSPWASTTVSRTFNVPWDGVN